MIRLDRKYQSICLFSLVIDMKAGSSSSVISLSLLNIFHVQPPIVSPHRRTHGYLKQALLGYCEANCQHL